jgi:hypothetical protein
MLAHVRAATLDSRALRAVALSRVLSELDVCVGSSRFGMSIAKRPSIFLDALVGPYLALGVVGKRSASGPPRLRPIDRGRRVRGKVVVMSFRTATVLGLSVALGAMLLGLAALGASSVGIASLRVSGFASLGVGGLLAGIVRWRMARHNIDSEALAQLATARAELDGSNPTAAGRAASKAVALARTSRTRNQALTTLAWAALGQGYPERAKAALDEIQPSHALDVHCLAAVECARGRTELAIQALEVAQAFGTLTCDGAKLLVDCYVRADGIERAVVAALQNRKVLGAANCEQVVTAARLAGANDAAAKLAAVLRKETPSLPVIGAQPG